MLVVSAYVTTASGVFVSAGAVVSFVGSVSAHAIAAGRSKTATKARHTKRDKF